MVGVDGAMVGVSEGEVVGAHVVGAVVGKNVLVGVRDGLAEGASVGLKVGARVGSFVGTSVGGSVAVGDGRSLCSPSVWRQRIKSNADVTADSKPSSTYVGTRSDISATSSMKRCGTLPVPTINTSTSSPEAVLASTIAS